jgi:integrase
VLASPDARLPGAFRRRSEQLDALASILPIERCDRLAQILSDDDVATLRHLVEQGMGENTLRALASDLGYLESWAKTSTGAVLPWPAPEPLVMKFIAHHLWDPAQRELDPSHGMPAPVAASLRAGALLRSNGPHAPATVKRRLASWGTLHRWRGLNGPFGSPQVRAALRLAIRASGRVRMRKSPVAITGDVLESMLATCWRNRLVDQRDRALLMVAFASGGRRRSEVARLRVEQLIESDPVSANPADLEAPLLRCTVIQLGRTKTTNAEAGNRVLLVGHAADALAAWLGRASIDKGAVFRAIDRWGRLQKTPLSPQSVNLIVKKRAGAAGLDARAFSAHGLRSGFLTETARQGISMLEAMQQSQHRSVQQVARYYNDTDVRNGRAVRVLL